MEKGAEKKGLDIDWNKLFRDTENEPPAELVVTAESPPLTGEAHQTMDGEEGNDELSNVSNAELIKKIERIKKLVGGSTGARLPDGGEKLKRSIQRHEEELERRKRQRSDKESDGCASRRRNNSGSIGACNGLGLRSSQSAYPSQSTFAVRFSNKLEEKQADSKTANAFQNELHALNPCGRGRASNRLFSQRRGRETSRKEPYKLRASIGEQDFYAAGKRGIISTPPCSEQSFSSCFPEKWKGSQAQPSCTLRHTNDVVLVDEEEPDVVEPRQQVYHMVESVNATKIFYPSRDDPESIEICSSDMTSLDPEAYLSSPIMNFYIRYLQKTKSPADGESCQCHFFNTFFYSKLKDAFSKQSDKEAAFLKLRRWWKGVNIFEKAYIFLPINETVHWSLIIICMPDRKCHVGPTVLHLDSLGLHCSKSLFAVMKKFLIEEWKFTRQAEVSVLPRMFADKIWENLPRRIGDRIIEVPQQGNEYDCGLFVLFFMERFISEVHERLRREDLAMFGRKWFKPEEASSMRLKIRHILEELFKNSSGS